MEKFDSTKHSELIKTMPFSYMSLPIYLDFCAYIFIRNKEPIVVCQDYFYPNDFPSFFLPKNPRNWERATMSMITADDVQKIKDAGIEVVVEIPTETEYFYKTDDFLHPRGKMKERINQFTNNYSFTTKNTYPKNKIKDFYKLWEDQRDRSNEIFEQESTRLFNFCLPNLEKYDVRQIYVEVEGKLAGFAWGLKHLGNRWVGLHLKVDYQYKGLSRFLQSERAKLFSDCDEFTLGTGCKDPGIIQFKKELGPTKEQQHFYVFTRNKKQPLYDCV